MGGQLIEALRIAASLATISHPGVAILAASPRLYPAKENQTNSMALHSLNVVLHSIN